jgi:hypothetical protein
LAVSGKWLAWRSRVDGRDFMRARNVANPAKPGPVKSLGRAGGAAQLGKPSVDGNRVVYARASKHNNAIVKRVLGGKRKRKGIVLSSKLVGLSNPALRGKTLLYVRHTARNDQLRLTTLSGGKGRRLLTRSHGTLWSTALAAKRAYVTVIQGTGPSQRLVSVKR